MAKTVKINGTDYTSYFTPKGQKVTYKSVTGKNAGYMLDGSYTEDEIAIKATITLTCIPLTEAQATALLLELLADTYVTLYYFDPLVNEYRTIEARRSVSEMTYRGTASSVEYWTGYVITLIER